MLSFEDNIGAPIGTASIADFIVSGVNIAATTSSAGIISSLFMDKELKTSINNLSRYSTTYTIAKGTAVRQSILKTLNEKWKCPLATVVKPPILFPWTIHESPISRAESTTSKTFKFSHQCAFIGRMFLRIRLPRIDLSDFSDNSADANKTPEHTYVGAWHPDLAPRLISQITLGSKSNSYIVGQWSGQAIFVNTLLFQNDYKRLIDLAQGEDLCTFTYDPYRVDSSAMGMSSFVGVDETTNYNVDASNGQYTQISTVFNVGDGFVDYYKYDSTMTSAEFVNAYRKNIWYENPVVSNYYSRHSIHSRRKVHEAFDIMIPLDFLPFGSTISRSIPSSALGSETGFIDVQLYSNWLERSFYLTRISDIAPNYSLVNHKHDATTGFVDKTTLGKTSTAETAPGAYEDDDAVLGGASTPNATESIIPILSEPLPTPTGENAQNPTVTGRYRGSYLTGQSLPYTTNISRSRNSSATSALDQVSDGRSNVDKTAFVITINSLNPTFAQSISARINFKLYQTSYSTYREFREIISPLPYVYFNFEYKESSYSIQENVTNFQLSSNSFDVALVFLVVPEDISGVPSYRVYPHQKIDHELPIMPGISCSTDSATATTTYDWQTMNITTPLNMGMKNELRENIGIISFTPCLTPYEHPYAVYDNNVLNGLNVTICEATDTSTRLARRINIRNGRLYIIHVGWNGMVGSGMTIFKYLFYEKND